MKCTIILLVFGIFGVIANPISNQITDDEKLVLDGAAVERNESERKQNEDTLNKGKPELYQKEVTIETPESFDANKSDAPVELVIQEEVASPFEQFPSPPEYLPQEGFDPFYGFPVEEDTDKFPLAKERGEVMDTAAGFAPMPFLRRRQKPRKHFSTRRNFKKNPYRRVHSFYPYYNYYTFYRPSSLRFY